MRVTRPLLALTVLVIVPAAMTGCGKADFNTEHHPEWVLHSRVVFLSPDLRNERKAVPLSAFRLWLPYIAGDFYGPPTTGDFIHPVLQPDYTFEVDLNRSHRDLLRSLQPTHFSLEFLKIVPADARVARLVPQALQSDGIEQIGVADWVDARSRQRLMLVFVDRPAQITGSVTRNGRTVRYDVRVAAAGYIWIGRRDLGQGEQTYAVVNEPQEVVLALTSTPAAAPARSQ